MFLLWEECKMKNYGEIVFHHENELQQDISDNLTVYNCGYYSASNATFHHKKFEKHAMLFYLHAGRATVYLKNNVKLQISAGTVIIFKPDSMVSILYHEDSTNERYYVFFNGTKIEELINSLNLKYLTPYETGNFDVFINTTKLLLEDFKNNGFENSEYKKIKIANIFAILHEFSYTKVKSNTYNPIAPAIQYMNQNLKEELRSSEDYAAMCGLSKNTFIKYFKLYTKTTPRKYCNTLKIENAKMQLSNTDKSINSIAYDLNFQDPFYFTRVFKQIVGISPTEYRNKQ